MKPIIEITPNINEWLANGEQGISSKAIVSHLTGINFVGRWGKQPPYDPSDLRRCMLLLEQCPELRPELHRMADVSPVWATLVAEWDDIITLLKEEMKRSDGMAPQTYYRIEAMRR